MNDIDGQVYDGWLVGFRHINPFRVFNVNYCLHTLIYDL